MSEPISTRRETHPPPCLGFVLGPDGRRCGECGEVSPLEPVDRGILSFEEERRG